MKNIILDTDIGPDCDDAGALALLNIYADMGLCRILAIGNCTSNPYGAGAIDAICRYYGREAVPIGTWKGREFLNDDICRRYNRPIAEKHLSRYREAEPEDAVRLYRRVLAAQPDNSVDIIAIGPLNNISALLDSRPDDVSPLDGAELVRGKVARLWMMAGIFRPSDEKKANDIERRCGKRIEDYAEYNVVCDAAASKNVADNWPGGKSYLGWEAGLMETGDSLLKASEDHPVRMAYELWNGGNKCRRCSWDPMTVLYAVDTDTQLVRDSAGGYVRFDDDGCTRFVTSPDGQDHYAELAANEEQIVEYINALLAKGL